MRTSHWFLILITLLTGGIANAAPPLNIQTLATVDRATLAAAENGDILGLEPYLAPDFQASIQIPTEPGQFQTLLFNREEFLLYAWHALGAAQNYQVRMQKADYRIARDGRSAVGTHILDESLHWEGQALSYTTRRTTHYRPNQDRIQITQLEVQVLKWDQP